jgi:predicted metalloprotease with PDZ domain
MMDVVSHEFFHIVTPLSIHSKEIQDFDYNDPKMSQHLWMYEGVTEYFANLFKSIKELTRQTIILDFQIKLNVQNDE